MAKLDGGSRIALLAVLVAACGDDATQGDESSSSGDHVDPSDSSGMPGDTDPTTTVDPDSSSSDDAATDDDTTTGGSPSGHARFIVREYAGVGQLYDPVIVEYADGVLSEPVALAPDLPEGVGIRDLSVTPSAIASYCQHAVPMTEVRCFARDVSAGTVSEAQSFNVGPLGLPVTIGSMQDAGTDGYVVRAEGPDAPGASLYFVPLEGSVLGSPRLLAASTPAAAIQLDPGTSQDGSWLGYRAETGEGLVEVFVVAIGDAEPVSVKVNGMLEPGQTVTGLEFMPSSTAILYSVETGRPQVTDDALYFVDLSGELPSAPLRVDGPADDGFIHGPTRLAEDGHALVYWFGGDDHGELAFLRFADGVPQPPALIDTQDAGMVDASPPEWSPDSRWVLFAAYDEGTGITAYYLAEADGDEPGTPIPVAPGSAAAWAMFTEDPQWLYFSASLDTDAYDLYRVDVSGAEPGLPQQVNAPIAPDGRISYDVVLSHDQRTLLYSVEEGGASAYELWRVDVSGAEPGVASRISAPVAPDLFGGFAKFSSDDSVLAYHVGPAFPGSEHQEVLVDLAAPENAIELSDNAFGVIALPD